jgi:hypothetical protein
MKDLSQLAIKTMVIWLFLCSSCFAQQVLKIEGPKESIGFGEIIEVKTNVEIKDDNGKPSHTIEWDLPRGLLSKSKFYYNNTLLAIPSGCTNQDIIVQARVIDWVNRRIDRAEFIVKVRGSSQEEPSKPIPSPGKYKDNPLYKVVIREYPKINDSNKVTLAKNMISAYSYVVSDIKTNSYPSIVKMMEDVRMRTVINQDDGSVIPSSQLQKWVNYRTIIGNTFNDLTDQGKLNKVSDYQVHFEAMVAALKEVTK